MEKELSFVLPKLSFDDALVSTIINLDYLRKKELNGTTNPHIFFQLKNMFHILESLGSARIEGNHTTLLDYIEQKLENPDSKEENFLEIQNSEKAIDFIEANIEHFPFNNAFITEIHKIVTKNLIKEGSQNPGSYRKTNVVIQGSKHKPPDYTRVPDLMDKLIQFINTDIESKYDLLKIALFHHHYTWIHPFDNGNGRTVRLLTYALLISCGFNVHNGRIINPTAIFDQDRDKYYKKLQIADSLENRDIIEWCEYMLGGFEIEIEKIDKLLDYTYLSSEILLPALQYSLERELITNKEHKILKVAVKQQQIQLSDIKPLFPGVLDTSLSRDIRGLRERNILVPIEKNKRTYELNFTNNYLVRGIIKKLDEKDFISMDRI